MTFKLRTGSRYKVRYRLGGQRYDREAVLEFCAHEGRIYYWSGRARWHGEKEVCGNFNLYGMWIKSIDPVPMSTPMYIGRRASGDAGPRVSASTTMQVAVYRPRGEAVLMRRVLLENIPAGASDWDLAKEAITQLAEDIRTGAVQ